MATRLAVVPKSAHNVKIVVTVLLMDAIPHEGNVKILIRDAEKRRYEISDFDIDGRAAVVVVEGAAFRVERFEEKYVLWSRGPVRSNLVVSVSFISLYFESTSTTIFFEIPNLLLCQPTNFSKMRVLYK